MFSPEGKIDHLVKKVVNKKLLIIPFEPAKDFTSNLVKQVSLLQASTNDLYIIQGMNKNKTRIYFSPKILIKEETVIDNSLLEVKKNQESVSFHWSKAKKYRPMIYFLSLESTNEEHTRVGIYTRDTNWYYPNTRKIPLILNNSTMHIPASGHYQAKLVLVDFDGWVSHLATQKFSI